MPSLGLKFLYAWSPWTTLLQQLHLNTSTSTSSSPLVCFHQILSNLVLNYTNDLHAPGYHNRNPLFRFPSTAPSRNRRETHQSSRRSIHAQEQTTTRFVVEGLKGLRLVSTLLLFFLEGFQSASSRHPPHSIVHRSPAACLEPPSHTSPHTALSSRPVSLS